MDVTNTPPAFKIINGIKWAYLKRGSGRNILCREHEYETYKSIENKSRVNFHSLYLTKQVFGLSSDIGGFNNLISKFTVLKRKLKLEGGEIGYEVRGGDILLTNITIDNSLRQTSMGLHTVSFGNDRWVTEPTEQIDTTHIAVNGVVENIEHAAKLMPKFIKHGYPGSPLNNASNYTLFYNPFNGAVDADWKCIQDSTGVRGGTHAARQLAAAMGISARDGQEINWTVHERGCAIFKQALRLANNSAQYDYSKQKVFYANPVVNMELVDQQRKRVGM